MDRATLPHAKSSISHSTQSIIISKRPILPAFGASVLLGDDPVRISYWSLGYYGVVLVILTLAVLIQYISVWQTDTHTDTRWQHIPRYRKHRAVKMICDIHRKNKTSGCWGQVYDDNDGESASSFVKRRLSAWAFKDLQVVTIVGCSLSHIWYCKMFNLKPHPHQ